MENEQDISCGLFVIIMVTILETGMCIMYKIRYSSIYRVYGIDHAKMPSLLSKGEGSTFIYAAQSSKLRALWSIRARDHITMCNAHNFLWSKSHQ